MNAIPLFKVRMPASVPAALGNTLASGYIAHGAQVTQFESALGSLLGTDRVCAFSDASAALTLALYLAGVRPGDDVVVSPLSCLATTMPVANLFANPAWCDIDPLTGMPDASHLQSAVTARTRAVVVYYWSGDVPDVAALRQAAPDIPFVADASEAFGAEQGGRSVVLNGADYTVLSFSAVRHLNTGEGGALIADGRQDMDLLRRARRYGIDPRTFRLPDGDLNPDSDIVSPGYSFAMNNIAATIGLEQFADIQSVISRYRQNGSYYDTALAGIPGITLLDRAAETKSGYWAYSLRAERRPDLIRKLHQHGIGAQRLHVRNDTYSCFRHCRPQHALPGVELFDAENLAIPSGWWVNDADRERIAACIRAGW